MSIELHMYIFPILMFGLPILAYLLSFVFSIKKYRIAYAQFLSDESDKEQPNLLKITQTTLDESLMKIFGISEEKDLPIVFLPYILGSFLWPIGMPLVLTYLLVRLCYVLLKKSIEKKCVYDLPINSFVTSRKKEIINQLERDL